MLPTFTNPWQFICWTSREILKTLSDEPSFFSSKRVERMLIFVNANVMLDLCTYHLYTTDKIDYIAAVAIYTAQMIYAGYTTKQIFNEKPKTSIEVDKSGSEEISNAKVTENK